MVQVFQVLSCFSCKCFQVHQVKKTNKWACKVCGEKQSVKKVYAKGRAAECRPVVQQLNMARGQAEMKCTSTTCTLSHDLGNGDENQSDIDRLEEVHTHRTGVAKENEHTSKWNQFMESLAEVPEENQDSEYPFIDGICYTTERPLNYKSQRSRKRKQRSNDQQQTSAKRFGPHYSNYQSYNCPFSVQKNSEHTSIQATANGTGVRSKRQQYNYGANHLIGESSRFLPSSDYQEMVQNSRNRGGDYGIQRPQNCDVKVGKENAEISNQSIILDRKKNSQLTPKVSSMYEPFKIRHPQNMDGASQDVSNKQESFSISSKWSKFIEEHQDVSDEEYGNISVMNSEFKTLPQGLITQNYFKNFEESYKAKDQCESKSATEIFTTFPSVTNAVQSNSVFDIGEELLEDDWWEV